jgi:phosphoglycerate kinase
VTNSSGSVTATGNWEAYGQAAGGTGSSATPYHYGATSGYRNDGDAGLLQIGARWYDPAVGRWMSAHPYRGVISNPLSLTMHGEIHRSARRPSECPKEGPGRAANGQVRLPEGEAARGRSAAGGLAMRFIGDPGFDARGKRVLVRVDFNVPLDEQGAITDDSRIQAALPTIRFLVSQQARVILVSHLGRPAGIDPGLSLAPVARRLGEVLGAAVQFVPDCIGPEVQNAVERTAPGGVLLLENLRFHPEEEANDAEFARQLAAPAELFVNDAFGAAHRAHASTVGVTQYLPSYAGFLLKKEVDILRRAMESPARPLVVILGGAKVKDKIGVVENLLPKTDAMLLGGGMAFTFLKAQGCEIGKSLLDEKNLAATQGTLRRAQEQGWRLELPQDVLVAAGLKPTGDERVVPASQIPADRMGVDIGPETGRVFGGLVRRAQTLIWNGPMGVFEVPEFASGTRAVGQAVQAMARRGGTAIIGGGDTVAAVEQLGLAEGITHLSTGGGASLEFLEGRELPGVAALN